jgi:hypothetical protein
MLISSHKLTRQEAAQLFAFKSQSLSTKEPTLVKGAAVVRAFIATHPNHMFEETFRHVYGGA